MKKRVISLVLAGVTAASVLAGCGNTANSSSSTGEVTTTASGAKNDEKQTVEFWYHDGNETSNAIFEELIGRFEEKYPQYTVKYVGLPSDSYLQKYNTAIATNTVPDVISVRDMDLSALINQDAIVNMDDIFDSFEEKDSINEAVIESVKKSSIDGSLYCLPQYITCDIGWYNTSLMSDAGIESPKTIDEFMQDCEKYADSANGKYFYSLRGGAGSLENLFDFLFTYANQYSFFDKEGNCVINQPEFAEALDTYASIYWNGWTSKDSVTNGFKEMVAEFGSGTSMFISHNSSSLAEHKKNLGENNFKNVIAPANSEGTVVTKDLSFVGYSVMAKAKNKEGAAVLAQYLVSAEAASYHCEKEGRIPINSLIYDDEWYVNDEYIKVYQDLMDADNVKFLTHPVWLTQWNEFRSKYQEPGFQAVLLKEKTSQEVLDSWAEYLTNAQKEYLSVNK